MFQFSGFAHLSVYYVFNIVGCPIRISTDQFVCADPRSFSQLITSFFASESLGIPHTPLFTSFKTIYFITSITPFCFVCDFVGIFSYVLAVWRISDSLSRIRILLWTFSHLHFFCCIVLTLARLYIHLFLKMLRFNCSNLSISIITTLSSACQWTPLSFLFP